MGTPHKHAAVIKAWADGKDIEWRMCKVSKWVALTSKRPAFDEDFEYRIKQEPKKMWLKIWQNIDKDIVLSSSAKTEDEKMKVDKTFADYRWKAIKDWFEVEYTEE
jgi:hypothetical protein